MEREEGLATSATETSTAEIATEKRTGNTSDQLPTICPKCGTENDPGMKFCGNCGTELGDNAAQPAPAKGLQKPQSSKSKKLKKRPCHRHRHCGCGGCRDYGYSIHDGALAPG